MKKENDRSKPVLVTGATGYVGGRLIPRLLNAGFSVRAMGRSLGKLKARTWADHPHVQLFEGDVLDKESISRAATGCRAAYYLVHSMIAQKGAYAEADRLGAQHMVAAAAEAGLERIIYLGGLGDVRHEAISSHLISRNEVAEILQAGPVPTTVLRAAMILGSGSASFEILRYLVERLPLMLTPRWVRTPSQPIAITNILDYLQGCLVHDEVLGGTFDIGGPDVLNYADLIRIFAEEAGLFQRWVIPVPVLTPGLSAKWIHLVTPIPAAIAQPLTEGLSVPTTCEDHRIRKIMPFRLIGCREAIGMALKQTTQEAVDTCWMDAGPCQSPEWAVCGDADYAGGTVLECGYRIRLQASPEDAWRLIRRIGGKTGWYYADALWRLRGLLDRLVGGVGLRRGRRHPLDLRMGDALDFWRVLDVDAPQRLVLLAEMKVPGEALLEIEIRRMDKECIELRFLSRFMPAGLFGITYWYALYPAHQLVFRGMLQAVAIKIGKKILSGPERFTPKLNRNCRITEG